MNSEELSDIEELCKELGTKARWIANTFSCKVYFGNCEVCGTAFSSNRSYKKKCRSDCKSNVVGIDGVQYLGEIGYEIRLVRNNIACLIARRRDFFEACCVRKSAENKHPVIKHEVTKNSQNKTGLLGVSFPNDRSYVTSKIMANGKTFLLYTGEDFFEACCARKSAENKRRKYEQIKTKAREKVLTQPQKNSSFNIAGVHWSKRAKKFIAAIRFNEKDYHLGNYDDFFDACCARKSAENSAKKGQGIVITRPQRKSISCLGILGVNWSIPRKRFIARINCNKTRYNLGDYHDFFEACCARKSAEARIAQGTFVN